jgi:hypothetical protein
MIAKPIAILLSVLLLGSVLTNCNTDRKLQAERLDHQTSKTAYAERVATAEKQRADEEAKRRKAEKDLTDAQQAHAQSVAAMQLDLDRARDRAAAVGVRDATASAAQRARAQCPGAAPSNVGTPAGDPIGVLADVLGRADARAGVLADLADRRYVAGRACEREYDKLSEALKAN